MEFLLPCAFASAVSQTSSKISALPNVLVMLVLFFAVMYFLIWRPQNKRIKSHSRLLSSLQKGDEVIMSNGMFGKISKIKDDTIKVNVCENVEIMFRKNSVSSILPKGTLKKVL